MQFFRGMLCVHHCIQVQVPYLYNPLVQVFNVDSPLNNNINEVIQCTYIEYGIIGTARHTKTSASNDTSTSITGTIKGTSITIISATTGTNTYQGIHTSTVYTSDTSTGISNTVISTTTSTNTYLGIHTSTICTSNTITGTIINDFSCSCYCY